MQVSQGLVPSIQYAGILLPLSQAIILTAAASNNQYDTMKNKGANYQVPVGKKLVLVAARVLVTSGTGGNARIGYGDDAKNDSTAPTNAVTFSIGTTTNYNVSTPGTAGSTAENILPQLEVPAGKYPYLLYSGTTGVCTFIGYLVNV